MADTTDLDVALDRARAAAWLLDQVHTGELSSICRTDGRANPQPLDSFWASAAAVQGMLQYEMLDACEDLLYRGLVEALAAARAASRELAKGGA